MNYDELKNYMEYIPGYVIQYKNFPGPAIEYNHEYLERYNNYDFQETLRLNTIRLKLMLEYCFGGKLSGKIHEFGYGQGHFLRIVQDYVLSVGNRSNTHLYGYDLNKLGIVGVETNIAPNVGKYDCVCMFDSLEHIMGNVPAFLGLIDTESIMISVPWFHESWSNEEFMNWKHRRPNEHYHHFDAHGLIAILAELGYNIVYIGNPEDSVRKSSTNLPNILTVIGVK